jgi:cell shape-determining protein MreC
MSQYRNTKKKYIYGLIFVIIGIIIFWRMASWIRVFRGAILPVYSDSVSLILNSKQSLIKKVLALQSEIDANKASLASLDAFQKENQTLKNELGRDSEGHKGIMARVVVPPNRSLYDTLIIDIGHEEGVFVGQNVYAFGSVALGTISDTKAHSSTVLLYSSPNRETVGSVSGSDLTVTLIGRGAGEYEVRMPRDIVFEQGGVITEQTLKLNTIAVIQKIVTDPRDPFQRLLAKVPVNLQTLKYVVVK